MVDVGLRHQKSWQQYVFFCWPFFAEYEGPDRYDVSVEIDKVLKGNLELPRQLHLDNARPPTLEERPLFGKMEGFTNELRLRIGYNHQYGHSHSGLVVVPLGALPTTQPKEPEYRLIPAVPAKP